MKGGLKMEGLREIDNALATLPKVVAKGVVKRGLRTSLQPVADAANAFWPGTDNTAFVVSDKLSRDNQKNSAQPNLVQMYVGNKRSVFHALFLEHGTAPRFHKSGKYVGAVAPMPSLTPAWDGRGEEVLAGLAAELRKEFDATMARRSGRGL